MLAAATIEFAQSHALVLTSLKSYCLLDFCGYRRERAAQPPPGVSARARVPCFAIRARELTWRQSDEPC